MKKSRKEFIKRAHESACSECKEKIESEFPKLFEEEEFKVGDWVVVIQSNLGDFGKGELGRVSDVDIGSSTEYAVKNNFYSNGEYNLWCSALRRATPQEIKAHLSAEAIKRGFVDKAMFNGVRDVELGEMNRYLLYQKENIKCGKSFHYQAHTDTLYTSGRGFGIIYEKGQWAEIIPERKKMNQKEIEKELGYQIEIVN